MADEWLEMTVMDLQRAGCLLVEDGNHGEYRPRQDEFGEGEWAFIRAADMDGGRVLFESADRISKKARDRIIKGIGAGGDILLSHKGTVGKVAFVPVDAPLFVCSPQTTFWRALDLDCLDRDYLYYYLCSNDFRQQLDARKGETDMAPYVSLTAQRQLKVMMPPIEVQRAIARILGVLDDKIELNRRMNRTLEAMAQAIFKSWFVDFDPVTARAEGRTPYSMKAETAALFPSAFEDSELGSIPMGWQASTVGNEFDLTMGQSPPGTTYNEEGEGIPFFQGRADFGVRYPTRRVYCTAPTRFANPGDTLVSVRAPVGDVNMAAEHCCIGRGLAAIRHNGGSRSYTYYTMRFLRNEFDIFEGEGTLFGSISGQGFRGIKIIAPDSQIVTEFEQRTYSLDQSIETNERQFRTLAAIRDALLPKLLSGEIRVRQAEKLVEKAL